jgi:hypothetical protein
VGHTVLATFEQLTQMFPGYVKKNEAIGSVNRMTSDSREIFVSSVSILFLKPVNGTLPKKKQVNTS